jgi:ketosteroid isomerase-like protein
MSEVANRQTVDRLFEGLNTRDLDLFHAQFHEDSVMEYPQSGERIVGGENRRGAYGAFPGLPSVDATRVRAEGDLVVVEARLDYGDGGDWRAVFIFELRDGLIASETAYFTQPFEPAGWRAPWVTRTEA